MLPTIRQLQYFVSAADIGTLSGAAAANHIAQPSLSEQIASLESGLNLTLFNRSSRGLSLTDAGRQLLPLAQDAIRQTEAIAQWGESVRGLEQGTVKFGTFSSAHLYLLTDLIKTFRQKYPGVNIRIVGLNSSEVADKIRSGELEAGLLQLPVDARGLTLKPSKFQDQFVYVSKQPFGDRASVPLRDIAERPFIRSEASWGVNDPLWGSMLERAQAEGLSLNTVVEVEHLTHALDLTAAGIGGTVASFHVARQWIKRYGLRWAFLDPAYEDHFAFATRPDSQLSPATKAFIDEAELALQRLAEQAPR
ncbi:MAG: LysR family transcriptional regulator [Gulosibacter sp.]|uniref:LysR family transcriptional regulator n=1 Tax=Gulosibacter sp. TaxID=2817531 RepID=UPI003F9164F6